MRGIRKSLFIGAGLACLAFGLIGIFLPVLPTTPFLLLAAFLFARSSTRALQWLLNNRWFGSYIRNYREGRGMAAAEKAFTLVTLWVTIRLTAFLAVDSGWVRAALLLVAGGVTFHLLRIKTYRPVKRLPQKSN